MYVGNISVAGTCHALPAANGRISHLNGTQISCNCTYPVGSRVALNCNEGYQRYGFYPFSDCVQPGIWVQLFTECIPDVDGEQNINNISPQYNKYMINIWSCKIVFAKVIIH